MRNKLATKFLMLVGAVALTCGLTSVPAHALVLVVPGINDGTGDLGAGPISIPGYTLAYQQISGGAESGSFAPSYSTTFTVTGSGFTIDYGSGASIACPFCVLVVGDGAAQNPDHYFFNLNGQTPNKNYDGTENITGAAFFPPAGPTGGLISYVAIHQASAVPEPASLLLLGAGLAGIWGWRRKFMKN